MENWDINEMSSSSFQQVTQFKNIWQRHPLPKSQIIFGLQFIFTKKKIIVSPLYPTCVVIVNVHTMYVKVWITWIKNDVFNQKLIVLIANTLRVAEDRQWTNLCFSNFLNKNKEICPFN